VAAHGRGERAPRLAAMPLLEDETGGRRIGVVSSSVGRAAEDGLPG
jgi:hypothetical protein